MTDIITESTPNTARRIEPNWVQNGRRRQMDGYNLFIGDKFVGKYWTQRDAEDDADRIIHALLISGQASAEPAPVPEPGLALDLVDMDGQPHTVRLLGSKRYSVDGAVPSALLYPYCNTIELWNSTDWAPRPIFPCCPAPVLAAGFRSLQHAIETYELPLPPQPSADDGWACIRCHTSWPHQRSQNPLYCNTCFSRNSVAVSAAE